MVVIPATQCDVGASRFVAVGTRALWGRRSAIVSTVRRLGCSAPRLSGIALAGTHSVTPWVDRGPHRHVMQVTETKVTRPLRLPRATTPRVPSPLELRLLVLIRASGFDEPVTEYAFARHLGRRRHTRGAGFEADHDKFNRATLLGWRVLRFTARHVTEGSALADLAEALGVR